VAAEHGSDLDLGPRQTAPGRLLDPAAVALVAEGRELAGEGAGQRAAELAVDAAVLEAAQATGDVLPGQIEVGLGLEGRVVRCYTGGMESEPEPTTKRFTVFLTHEEDGWSVVCPAFEGCFSCGATREEALANIREAIELCIETEPMVRWLREHPAAEVETVELCA
jgi:predicted RNase H-like HicB family nuclease